MKKRHWKHKEDLILVETVTEYISKGISITEAFPEATNRLVDRTVGACSSRWFNYLAHMYGEAVQIAERKQKENAKRIVESMLDNQEPLEVSFEKSAKVEMTVPSYDPAFVLPELSQSMSGDGSLDGLIQSLVGFNNRYKALQNENEQLYESLEEALVENEELKVLLVQKDENALEFSKQNEIVNLLISKAEELVQV